MGFQRVFQGPPGSSTSATEIEIGEEVVGGTEGSVLFVGAGGVLAQDNTNFFWDDTNDYLGIGKNNPSVSLDVIGDVRATGAYNGQTYTNGSGETIMLSADEITFDAGGAERMRIDSLTGNVGIGTDDPQALLDIAGLQKISGTGTSTGIKFASTPTVDSGYLYAPISGIVAQEFISGYNVYTDTNNNNPSDEKMVSIYTGNDYFNGTNRVLMFSILKDGNAGINTGKQVSRLEVNGSVGEKITTVASATATLADDSFVSVTYTATGAVTLTLPTATSVWNSTDGVGRIYTIADTGANAGTNNITINRASTDTIITSTTGNTSTSIVGNGDVIRIIAISATTWKVL